jgi:glycosyltransferase involved in cell wall biosynthesis
VTSISLVIPVHNEAENIAEVIARSRRVLTELATDYQIVVVDDASSDGSSAVATAAMGTEADRLTVVRHERQQGYGVTICDGLRASTKEVLAFIDGDGQFDPADLALLASWIDRAALVTGRRTKRADPFHRSVVSGVFNVLVRVLYGVRYRDVDCGMKMMRREVFEASSPIIARSAVFNTEIYFKARRNQVKIKQIDVPHHPRVAGVRSGGRLVPIARAVRDLVRLRLALRTWSSAHRPVYDIP